MTLPEAPGRQLARHGGGPASGAEGAAPTGERRRGRRGLAPRGAGRPRRRCPGRGAVREWGRGSPRRLPLGGERALPSVPCWLRSQGRGVRGRQPGRGAEELGAGGGGWGVCGAVRCQLGSPAGTVAKGAFLPAVCGSEAVPLKPRRLRERGFSGTGF